MTDAYPLSWPAGWPRTEYPKRAAFKTTGGRSMQNLLNQLQLMKASNLVISSNVMLRLDGLPYANQRRPDDPGVAVYFTLKGEQQCIPCDRWDLVDHNIHAIGLTVEALRGLERWGPRRWSTQPSVASRHCRLPVGRSRHPLAGGRCSGCLKPPRGTMSMKPIDCWPKKHHP